MRTSRVKCTMLPTPSTQPSDVQTVYAAPDPRGGAIEDRPVTRLLRVEGMV